MDNNKKPIASFRDLEVYKNSYGACILVMKKLLPKIPDIEKYDLKDQLRRSCKAIPRLIAEGYAKRHQKHGFQKYLDDAMAECNETLVGVEMCRDIYGECVDDELCSQLIDIYDKTGRQIYKLSEAWRNFKNKKQEKSD